MAKDQKSWRSVHTPSFSSLLTDTTSPIARADETGDIILYDSHLVVYRHSLDVAFYLLAGPTENELMINAALNALVDGVQLLLRNPVEKRGILENLDLVLLCLDETIDDGCVCL
jgi:hypothetical protein